MNTLQQVTINPPRLLMFDLDGTLVDSVPDLCFAVDAMLKDLGRPSVGIEKVSLWVGNGAAMLVKRALSQQMIPIEMDASLFKNAYGLFLKHYKQINGRQSVLYPKVVETLIALRKQYPYMALITNKPEQFTQPLLDYHHLPKFDLVVCGDTLEKRKPHPEPILHCMRLLDCSANESVMVGDSVSDIKAAQAAKVPIICVNYGYNQGENLASYQPDRLIQNFGELLLHT